MVKVTGEDQTHHSFVIDLARQGCESRRSSQLYFYIANMMTLKNIFKKAWIRNKTNKYYFNINNVDVHSIYLY